MVPPAKKQSWRLKKTLSRKITFRPIEDADIKFVFAAYRQGGLAEIFDERGLEPKEFKARFEAAILTGFDAAWVVETDKPIGLILGVWHPASEGALMTVAGVSWFPWATARNVIEGTVGFFNEARKEVQMIGYVRPEHKRLYEVVLKHGIMRRIGTSHSIYTDAPATVFETRAP